ncbi:MAG TPA: GNAT family N-acetyltransferase [Anaerolineales bacterium]|nr:GNAT family N-acetyltransferase [Anaerolineales bacterium]
MHIEKVSEATGELLDALDRLIPQLSAHKKAPTWDELTALINSEFSALLIARYSDERNMISGMLTLVIYRVPTGIRSIIEDVVVDQVMRRQGIAEALLEQAIEVARQAGAGSVSLTSNSQRVAANQLYRSIGFKRRETNAYSYDLNLK